MRKPRFGSTRGRGGQPDRGRGNEAELATTLVNIGGLQRRLGRLQAAKASLERATDIEGKAGSGNPEGQPRSPTSGDFCSTRQAIRMAPNNASTMLSRLAAI